MLPRANSGIPRVLLLRHGIVAGVTELMYAVMEHGFTAGVHIPVTCLGGWQQLLTVLSFAHSQRRPAS